MNIQKGTAAHLGQQAAGKNELHKTQYIKPVSLSSNFKQEIGTLLLCLQFPVGPELNQIGWGLFEILLNQYVGLKVYQNGYRSRCGGAGTEKSGQPD